MNHRVKALWLPALAAIVASFAMLCMLYAHAQSPVAQLLRNPQCMEGPIPHRMWSAVYLFFDWRWLVVLPIIGAFTAYWSRRQGGKFPQRVLAAVAPAIGFGGFVTLFILAVSIPHIGHSMESFTVWFRALAMVFGLWVIAPALALLLGAFPFLRKQNLCLNSLTIAS